MFSLPTKYQFRGPGYHFEVQTLASMISTSLIIIPKNTTQLLLLQDSHIYMLKTALPAQSPSISKLKLTSDFVFEPIEDQRINMRDQSGLNFASNESIRLQLPGLIRFE